MFLIPTDRDDQSFAFVHPQCWYRDTERIGRFANRAQLFLSYFVPEMNWLDCETKSEIYRGDSQD